MNPKSVYLDRITLTNYRNYSAELVKPSPYLNLITGLNGMGKTTLLDAVYYLCMTKSYLVSGETDLIRKDAGFMRLEGVFKHHKKEKIVVKVASGRKKEFERNDIAYKKLSEHIGLIKVVMIAPDDTLLVTEGSENRRKFMDNTLSQSDPQYLEALITYHKLLDQRNAALKQMDASGIWNETLILTYEKLMIEPSIYIHEARKAFADKINPIFLQIYESITTTPEPVNFHYESKLLNTGLADLFDQTRHKDRILQRTTAGIHRDDLVFMIHEEPLKKFGSQGQLKSFIISLKLAQYEILRSSDQLAPLLLLDDFFDKLDEYRVSNLMKLMTKGNFGQIFITDTSETRLPDIIKQLEVPFHHFTIENGAVGKIETYEYEKT